MTRDQMIDLAIRDVVTLFGYVAHAPFTNWPPHAQRLIVAMAWTEESIPALHRIADYTLCELYWTEKERNLTALEAHVRTIARRFRNACEAVAREKNIDLYSDKRGDRAAARKALDDASERALWHLNSSSKGTVQ